MPLALFAVPVIATLAVGPSRVLAYYQGVVHVGVDPLALLERTGMNLLVLLYASGFVLVPGAILGLALVLARPRTRGELAFGAMALFLAVSLLVEAGLFGAFEQAQERYLFYFLPLVFLSFGLYAARGWPFRLYHALLAAGVVTVAAAVPLAGYAASDEKAHSAALYGVFRIEAWLGTPGNGSIAVALAGTVGLAVLVACSARMRVASAAGIALAILFSSGLAAAGVVFDQENARSVRQSFLPADPSWVDHAHVGHVALLRNIAGVRGSAFQQLFWNLVRKGTAADAGRIRDRPLPRRPHPGRRRRLPDGRQACAERCAPRRRPRGHDSVLRRRQGRVGAGILALPPRRATAAFALLPRPVRRRLDGRQGNADLWPRPGSDRLEGTLVLDLESPAPLGATTVQFHLPGGRVVHVRVPAHGSTTVRLPVCSQGPWATGVQSKLRGFLNDRPLSVKAGIPRFVPAALVDGLAEQHPAPPVSDGQTA